MTKVIMKPRPLASVQLAPVDSFRMRLGDVVLAVAYLSLVARALRWLTVRVFRREPRPLPVLKVIRVDHETGRLTLELQ